MDENVFEVMFEAWAHSPTFRDVWRDAYGDDYPETADPASFITVTDLRRIIGALGLSEGEDLVDLGCGPGGPGSDVARATGARLTGIDPSRTALDFARRRHLESLPTGSRFELGDFTSTGLPDGFADGVMSTDALLFVADQAAAFREVARILKPESRLAFTSFELRAPSRALGTAAIPDYRPFLESAGFSIEAYDETPDWEPRMRAVFSGILAQRDQLSQELGEPAAPLTFAWATLRPPELSDSRRVLAVARRQ